jgi:hypothetical protein
MLTPFLCEYLFVPSQRAFDGYLAHVPVSRVIGWTLVAYIGSACLKKLLDDYSHMEDAPFIKHSIKPSKDVGRKIERPEMDSLVSDSLSLKTEALENKVGSVCNKVLNAPLMNRPDYDGLEMLARAEEACLNVLPEHGWSHVQLINWIESHCRGIHEEGSTAQSLQPWAEAMDALKSAHLLALKEKLSHMFAYAVGRAYFYSMNACSSAIHLESRLKTITMDLFGAKAIYSGICSADSTGWTRFLPSLAQNQIHDEKQARPVLFASARNHAWLKNCLKPYYKVVLLPSDSWGRLSLEAFQKNLALFGNRSRMLVASAPGAMTGSIDPIAEMAALAMEHDLYMHLDCGAGGFVARHLVSSDSKWLMLKGITSLSIDLHNSGLAPERCSVLLSKTKISCVSGNAPSTNSLLCALTSMLATGGHGYRQIAKKTQAITKKLKNILAQHAKHLDVLANQDIHMVAFKLHNPESRDDYPHKFAAHMVKHNFKVRCSSEGLGCLEIDFPFITDANSCNRFLDVLNEGFCL